MDNVHLKISEAARMTGVSASTLRLWEQHGLVEPLRTESGQRVYDAALVERLKAIAWLRSERGLNPAAIKAIFISQTLDRETIVPVTRTAETEVDEVPMGTKVRRLRREAGLTLDAMAQATNVAVSLLSTFERSSRGLSIAALHSIARSLGTTLASLSGQDHPRSGASLIRNKEWQSWPTTASGVTVHILARGNNEMECHRFDLAPGASSEGAYQHEGEEFIHVLAGSLEIILDGDQFYELRAGDSFYFVSTRLHAWRNRYDGQTSLIWINTPPTF